MLIDGKIIKKALKEDLGIMARVNTGSCVSGYCFYVKVKSEEEKKAVSEYVKKWDSDYSLFVVSVI